MLKKLFAKLMGPKKQKKARKTKPARAAKTSRTKTAPKKKPAKKAVRRAAPKKSPRKPAAGKKPKRAAGPKKPAPPAGDEVGEVVAFFRIPVVAVIKLKQGSLKVGERIWIHGHTTDLKQTIDSMQINHKSIQEARKGQEIGIKVSARTRRGDRVYRIAS